MPKIILEQFEIQFMEGVMVVKVHVDKMDVQTYVLVPVVEAALVLVVEHVKLLVIMVVKQRVRVNVVHDVAILASMDVVRVVREAVEALVFMEICIRIYC